MALRDCQIGWGPASFLARKRWHPANSTQPLYSIIKFTGLRRSGHQNHHASDEQRSFLHLPVLLKWQASHQNSGGVGWQVKYHDVFVC
jgi:hypothetical protein